MRNYETLCSTPMRKRVEDIGGRFELHSQSGQGTRIVLELDRKRR